MLVSVIRASFGVILTVCLAGCGGSNSGSGVCVTDCGGGGNPTTVTYTFTGAMPTAVATQIGSGAYTQATVASGKVSISLPSGTSNYSIAWVCPADARYTTPVTNEYVYQASTKDGTSLSWYCDDDGANETSGAATLQVDASAITGGAYIYAPGGIGDNSASLNHAWASGIVNLSGQMITGTYDVFVAVQDANYNTLAVKILRNQTIPGALNSGNPVVFAASDETTTQTLTVSNIPSGFSASDAFIYFETADFGDSFGLNDPLKALGVQYTALPSSAIQSGDYYWFESGASGGGNEYVGVQMDTTNVPPTITLPTPWPYAGPTAAALPTFNLSYAGFSGTTNVQYRAGIDWGQGATFPNQIQLTATANYQNGSTSITIPDLSELTGFLAPAASATNVSWYAGVTQGPPLLSDPANGTWLIVQDYGTYTEP